MKRTILRSCLEQYVAISVADTGTGIREELLDRIFEPFFTTKETGKGTGLGLSIAYGIINQYHGLIDVSTQTGAGTIFTVYLPRYEAEKNWSCLEYYAGVKTHISMFSLL